MNPELLQITARSHQQDLLRAAQHERLVRGIRRERSSGIVRSVLSMRLRRRGRALAIRTAAVGKA